MTADADAPPVTVDGLTRAPVLVDASAEPVAVDADAPPVTVDAVVPPVLLNASADPVDRGQLTRRPSR